ncbi:hypothetical protein BKA82DRAFT_4018682 [Pisolithus tinctorius]|nr:hypothetical protein BKA82DRAFT_4018682 [Pisolithus tinctorius]
MAKAKCCLLLLMPMAVPKSQLQPNEAAAELQRQWENQQRQRQEQQQEQQDQGDWEHQLEDEHQDPQEVQPQCQLGMDRLNNPPQAPFPPPHPQSPPLDPVQTGGQPIDLLDFNPNKPVPSTIQMHPSEYAIKHLEAFKYVPLWMMQGSHWCLHAKANYDHDLPFNDLLFTRNRFLLHIEGAKWSPKVVDSFNWLFFNIETHAFRQQGEWGERVLLHYAS